MNKMFRATAVIAALFIHLGIFYCSGQLNHEFFIHSFNTIRVITFWILAIFSAFFQLCQSYSGFLGELLAALQFPQGEETSGPLLGGAICRWNPWAARQFNRVFFFNLPGGPKVI